MSYHILTYSTEGGPRAGIHVEGRIHDIARALGEERYAAVTELLEDWAETETRLEELAASGAAGDNILSDVRLHAPILYPGQIYGAGSNYSDHRAEMAAVLGIAKREQERAPGELPFHFLAPGRACTIGPGESAPYPAYAKKLDWEIELAVVIGKKARNVGEADALDYIAGYTIANDLTARDAARRPDMPPDSPFLWDYLNAKGFEAACPMGPWITPAKYIGDPANLAMKLWVNDKIMQDSSSSYMIFNIQEQIAALSLRTTLYPGDVIMTGTPAGVGMGCGLFLAAGDKVTLEIENIGTFTHHISAAR